jgi:predicted alpha/beta hydrolase
VHGLAQAAWDVRSAIRWIRFHEGTAPVGLYGLSLGGYAAALTASLEDDLACVIAGIPATDIVDLYRRHSPVGVRRKALAHGALGPKAIAVHRVVSPLVLDPKPPRGRRFLFAGIGDRMSTSRQARRLWEHWDRPEMAWYPGGHVGFFWAGAVSRFVEDALAASGVIRATGTGERRSLSSAEPAPS